ncbi:MAG: hypothetical protein LE180_05905 [Endomicrobium sp.]|uniref:hypothetical protein n=1 Tax=Candidatus Endomicrobiellum pyrsonymphae TaxID=1408203 RepID=UPI00357EC149|nr:hypothetical protein [Endomicrobium sp.]
MFRLFSTKAVAESVADGGESAVGDEEDGGSIICLFDVAIWRRWQNAEEGMMWR